VNGDGAIIEPFQVALLAGMVGIVAPTDAGTDVTEVVGTAGMSVEVTVSLPTTVVVVEAGAEDVTAGARLKPAAAHCARPYSTAARRRVRLIDEGLAIY
jgi:hypothetical protein